MKALVQPQGGENRYVFFSGKGGVGKTTISAATAVWLADAGYKTLIVSTDLQRSLDDIFEQRLDSIPTPIHGVPNLEGVTIDTAQSIEKHRGKILETLRLLDPNSLLLKQMVDDKVTDCGCAQAALFEFTEYLNSRTHEVVVFDTAPMGAQLEKIASQTAYTMSLVGQIEVKARLADMLGGEGLRAQVEALKAIKEKDEFALTNLKSESTSYILVMLPESLPYEELCRNLEILEVQYEIPVRGIVINAILPASERERTEFWIRRWSMQKRFIDLAYKQFGDRLIGEVPLLPTESVGIPRLRSVGRYLYGKEIVRNG